MPGDAGRWGRLPVRLRLHGYTRSCGISILFFSFFLNTVPSSMFFARARYRSSWCFSTSAILLHAMAISLNPSWSAMSAKAGIQLGVLLVLAVSCGFQVVDRVPDDPGRVGSVDLDHASLEKLEEALGVFFLVSGRFSENGGNLLVSFFFRLGGEVMCNGSAPGIRRQRRPADFFRFLFLLHFSFISPELVSCLACGPPDHCI